MSGSSQARASYVGTSLTRPGATTGRPRARSAASPRVRGQRQGEVPRAARGAHDRDLPGREDDAHQGPDRAVGDADHHGDRGSSPRSRTAAWRSCSGATRHTTTRPRGSTTVSVGGSPSSMARTPARCRRCRAMAFGSTSARCSPDPLPRSPASRPAARRSTAARRAREPLVHPAGDLDARLVVQVGALGVSRLARCWGLAGARARMP